MRNKKAKSREENVAETKTVYAMGRAFQVEDIDLFDEMTNDELRDYAQEFVENVNHMGRSKLLDLCRFIDPARFIPGIKAIIVVTDSYFEEDFPPSLEYVSTHFSPTIGETDTDFSPSISVGKRRRFWEERRRFVSPRDFYLILFYQKDKKNFCTCSVF